MPATVYTQRTGRFIEWWSHVALGASMLVFLALIISPFLTTTLIDKTVTATPDNPAKLEAIKLGPQLFGSLRVDALAQIRTNEWVNFEIRLLDKEGKLLTSAIKEAWSETGTWYEDGESGTWEESDLLGGIDVRAKKDEPITVALSLLGYGNTSGRELEQPVNFKVTVQNGIVDIGQLWLGLIGSFIMAVFALIGARAQGKKAIAEKINDSDATGRGTLGGKDRLVRLNVDVNSDETTPPDMKVYLSINNAYGELVYEEAYPVSATYQKNDGRVKSATASLRKFFVLEERGSYGFHVEVVPDEPIDKTTVTVRDQARTLVPVDVTYIPPSVTVDTPKDSI